MIFSNHSVLFLILISIFSNEILASTLLPVTRRTKIVKSNWPVEYMDQTVSNVELIIDRNLLTLNEYGLPTKPIGEVEREVASCIKRDNSGKIQIGLSFSVYSLSDMNNALPVYLRYTVASTSGIISVPEMAMTQQSGSYTFDKTVEIDLSNLGDLNPVDGSFMSTFSYSFELLTQHPYQSTYLPYPIEDFPNLFVEYIDKSTPLPISLSEVLAGQGTNDPTQTTGEKLLCLTDITNPLKEDGNNKSITPSKEEASSAPPHSTSIAKINLDQKTFSSPALQVYPNPFKDKLVLKGIDETALVEIIDLNGQIMLSEQLSTAELPTSFLAHGVYICRIHLKERVHHIKIMKH